MSASQSTPSHLGLALFNVTWAVYTLIHLLIDLHRWWQDPLPLVLGIVAGAAAVSVLFRPSSLSRMGLLIVAWSAQKIYFLPFLPNHVFLTLCTHLLLLLSIGWVLVRSRPSLRGPAVYEAFAPLIRIEILILYLFAVVHKLNTAFFDSAVSCGWALYQEIASLSPLLPTADPLPVLTIYGTIGIEALIPTLLLFRRTRLWGIGLGLVFHLMLALGPRPYVASFSTLLIAIYTLFLPHDIRAALVARVRTSRLANGMRVAGRLLQSRAWGLLTAAGLGIGTLVLVDLWADAAIIRRLVLETRTVGQFLYYGWGVTALWFFGHTVWARRSAPTGAAASSSLFRPVLTPGVVVLGIVLLNGLSPYVGLKTEMSFSMFSNLRTEAGRSNHFFLPLLHRGNGYQDDLVTVLDGSSAWMTAENRAHERIPFFELRRRTSRAPSNTTWVQYKRKGHIETIRYAEAPGHLLFQPLPLWERKLLRFRPVPSSDVAPMACGH